MSVRGIADCELVTNLVSRIAPGAKILDILWSPHRGQSATRPRVWAVAGGAHGLLQTWFEVLLRIGRAGQARLKMCDLANEIALTTSGVTRLIDRIVEAGYVQRTPSDSDRRVLYLELTESGHDILEAACRTHLKDLDEQMFSRLTRRDAQQLDSLLEKLR